MRPRRSLRPERNHLQFRQVHPVIRDTYGIEERENNWNLDNRDTRNTRPLLAIMSTSFFQVSLSIIATLILSLKNFTVKWTCTDSNHKVFVNCQESFLWNCNYYVFKIGDRIKRSRIYSLDLYNNKWLTSVIFTLHFYYRPIYGHRSINKMWMSIANTRFPHFLLFYFFSLSLSLWLTRLLYPIE